MDQLYVNLVIDFPFGNAAFFFNIFIKLLKEKDIKITFMLK